MEHKKWLEMYQNEKTINLDEILNKDDYDLLKRLEIVINEPMCTGAEYERLSLAVGAYYEDENMTEEDKEGFKELSSVGVSKEEYDRLFKKFELLDKKYYEILRKHSWNENN